MIKPNKPEHADKVEVIAGVNQRLTIKRHLDGYSYPENGNVHNPTPRYIWLLLADGIVVDHDTKRGPLVEAARQNGDAYLAEVDSTK